MFIGINNTCHFLFHSFNKFFCGGLLLFLSMLLTLCNHLFHLCLDNHVEPLHLAAWQILFDIWIVEVFLVYDTCRFSFIIFLLIKALLAQDFAVFSCPLAYFSTIKCSSTKCSTPVRVYSKDNKILSDFYTN